MTASSRYLLDPDEISRDEGAASIVGQKAAGLQLLPPKWVPAYFVISTRLCNEIRNGASPHAHC